MKTTITKEELKELGACDEGYQVFVKAHGVKETKLSLCLASNGWDDVWWLLEEIQLSNQQKVDLRLLGCEYALSSLSNFEKEYPEDKRPRKAIEASQAFARGEITQEDLTEAASAAWSAASRSAARSAAESAAWSADSVAWSAAAEAASASARSASAASAAARSAASALRSLHTSMLLELLEKWERT